MKKQLTFLQAVDQFRCLSSLPYARPAVSSHTRLPSAPSRCGMSSYASDVSSATKSRVITLAPCRSATIRQGPALAVAWLVLGQLVAMPAAHEALRRRSASGPLGVWSHPSSCLSAPSAVARACSSPWERTWYQLPSHVGSSPRRTRSQLRTGVFLAHICPAARQLARH